MASQELYNILKFERNALPEFLKLNCKYDYLKSLLIKLENDNINKEEKELNLIKALFLGQLGNESNKQRAIYELPTEELMVVIKYICDFLNIKHIEEVAAGQGLLSYMLKYYLGDDYNVVATDGFRWMETVHNTMYYPVSNKLLLTYCLDNISFDDKLLIISWVPENDASDFWKLLETKSPKNIVIIGCPYDNHIFDLRIQLDNRGYTSVGIPTKQLCYRDYFKYNKYYPKDSSRSSIIFATNDASNINTMLLNMKLKHDNCLCKKITKISDKLILQDIIVNNIGNYYLLDSLEDNMKFKKLLKFIPKLLQISAIVPTYLRKYKEFVFWSTKIIQNKYPLNISTREKFKEYKQNIIMLNTNQDAYLDLINQNVIPSWVSNIDDAEKCIWLDFSHSSKKWKESRNIFLVTFNNLYANNDTSINSFMNFTSIIN